MTEEILFAEALAKTTPEERRAFLENACPEADLRRRVEELLRLHDATGGLLDKSPPTLTMAPPAMGECRGTRIGPYKLLEKIGEGGMGTVYMAEQDKPVRRRVALKIIKAGMDSAQVVARFEAERQAIALMDHPNIAKVLDGGATETNRPFFVMELVKGIPITKFCDEQRLTPRQRLDLFLPVCQAVQHAHQKGIIHRDLKPSNILVAIYDDKPVPKVIDFGVAKATGERLTDATLFTGFGSVVGTLEYMSPEQAKMNALDVDTRADIYSLGVVLYELLTGSTPFDKTRLKQAAYDEWLRIIREEEPAKPSTRLSSTKSPASVAASRNMEPAQLTRLVRGELDWIVMKSLEKDRTRRYETANGLARDLQSYLADEPVEACPPSARYRLGKLVRKHKRALATTTAFVLILIAGVIVSSLLAVRATEAEQVASDRLADVETARSKLQEALAETKEAHGKTSQALNDTRLANEKTREALKESEEARKQAEEVSRFMTETFLRARPVQDGRNLKVADVLNAAEKKLEVRADLSPTMRADLLLALSETYFSLDLRPEALRTAERAWGLRKQYLGTLNSKTIDSLLLLHKQHTYMGNWTLMTPQLEEVLNEGLAKWPPEHPTNRILVLSVCASYLSRQPEKGLALIERTPTLLAPSPKDMHDPKVLEFVTMAAKLCADAGQCDKGNKMMEDYIARSEAALGPKHLLTLTAMMNLADVWGHARYSGNDTVQSYQAAKAKSIEQRERALVRIRASVKNDDALLETCLRKLAFSLRHSHRHARAVEVFEEVLEVQLRRYGRDAIFPIVTRGEIGTELILAGKSAQAIPILKFALSDKDRFGNDHGFTLRCMCNLAIAYQEIADFAAADAELNQALSLNQGRGTFRTNLVLIATRNKIHLGKTSEAERLLTSVAAGEWTAVQGPQQRSQQGALLLEKRVFAAAEKLLLAAQPHLLYQQRFNTDFDHRLFLRDNLDWLVRLYEDWDKPDEAAKWRKVRDQEKEPKK